MATPKPKSKQTLRTPASTDEWKRLIQEAIERAERTNDRRLAGLKQALIGGNVEAHLKKLGIISVEDVDREFPDKS